MLVTIQLYTTYSKMAADLCAYKLALVASFKIKYSFEFSAQERGTKGLMAAILE